MPERELKKREHGSACREPGGLRWTFADGFGGLPGVLAPLLGRRETVTPQEEQLKSSAVRKVRLVEIPPDARSGAGDLPNLILKEHILGGPGAMMRAVLSGRPARREWTVMRHLCRAGVPVPEPLALGEPTELLPRRSGGVLALRAVAGAVTLEDLLLGRKPLPAPARTLADELGRIVRAMHDAAVTHPDLHAANILVSPGGALRLIDFHSAAIRTAPLPIAARLRDLTRLSGAFLMAGRRTERFRFFRAYCRGLDGMKEIRSEARTLEATAWKRLGRFLKKHDKRPLRSGRAFLSLAVNGWRGMGENSERATRLARLLTPRPAEILDNEGRGIKRDTSSTVHSLSCNGGRYIVKVYSRPCPWQRTKAFFLGSRAQKAWINGHRLLFRLLPAARPVLYLNQSFFARGGRSIVVFEEAVNLPTLDRYAARASRRALENTIDRLARTVARMHNFFLANRDLKAQNILIDGKGAPLFVDPDGVRPAPVAGLYIMARDLMRLNASFHHGGPVKKTDRLRFLSAYARARRLDGEMENALRSRIAELTKAKWDRWRCEDEKRLHPKKT